MEPETLHPLPPAEQPPSLDGTRVLTHPAWQPFADRAGTITASTLALELLDAFTLHYLEPTTIVAGADHDRYVALQIVDDALIVQLWVDSGAARGHAVRFPLPAFNYAKGPTVLAEELAVLLPLWQIEPEARQHRRLTPAA